LYVAIVARPPIGEALLRTVWPTRIDPLRIVTIVGGTVGGYITFAGAHRLIDAGITGAEEIGPAVRSASLGIVVASAMRIVLFLGALGIVARGLAIDPANPPASVFRLAAGELGYRLFGIVMWAASITSVVGSAYTSISFLERRGDGATTSARTRAGLIIGFIALSTVVFLAVGRPVTILVLVGAINGLVLPLGLGAMLLAAIRSPYRATVRTPIAVWVAGLAVAAAMAALGGYSLVEQIPALLRS
jgi:Mn2+/Fe2+ NRAMP family transporter